ncbi:MAG: VTT domain-containing protein [Tetrasphaera sp.]|nr:VTT domain-containing protein [Tetrasphaera sp.]
MHGLATNWMDPAWLLERFGSQFFWVSTAIVFIECGLLFPILPGDSLLFAIGLFIANGTLDFNLVTACVILSAAAFAGNVAGYEIGRAGTPPIGGRGAFVNAANFDKTHAFFERYGAKALILGRFVPIVRTFITVVAGVGRMDRRHFFLWSGVGAVLWAVGVTLAGYFLGQTFPGLKDHLEMVILLIVAVSVLPMVYEYLKHRREAARTRP